MPEEDPFAAESIVNKEPDTPGTKLSAARFEYDLSRADVAAYLNLSEAVIAALENGDYDQLPGPTFAKGYMRAYARLLNLDEEEIVSGIEVAPQDRLEVPRSAGGGRSRQIRSHRRHKSRWGWVLLLLVVLVVAGWLLFGGGGLKLPAALQDLNLPFAGGKKEPSDEITFPAEKPGTADQAADQGNALLEKTGD